MKSQTMRVVAEAPGDEMRQIIGAIEAQAGRIQSARNLLNLLAEQVAEDMLLCGAVFTAANALEAIEDNLDKAVAGLRAFERREVRR